MNRPDDSPTDLSFPRRLDTRWLLRLPGRRAVNEHYPLFDGGRLLAATLLCLVLGSWISLVHKSLHEPSATPLAPALAQPEQQR